MTDAQKNIITRLFEGCSIYGSQQGFRVRDTNHNAVCNLNPRTWRQIKYYVRKDKTGLFVIDKRKVRKEHGNTWIKQTYKSLNQK